ncbi:MAG: hypothetical protein EXR36_13425 [Betaproteobacteria bacterium]|nr:hypothetical protein [Betaproteobacteria bacterium]
MSWPVRIRIEEDSFEWHAVNASIHGIRLVTSAIDMLKVGASYHVGISIGGSGRFPCTAEVRRLGERGAGMETSQKARQRELAR